MINDWLKHEQKQSKPKKNTKKFMKKKKISS